METLRLNLKRMKKTESSKFKVGDFVVIDKGVVGYGGCYGRVEVTNHNHNPLNVLVDISPFKSRKRLIGLNVFEIHKRLTL